MVPFWISVIIRALIFRVPQKGDHNFDIHSYRGFIGIMLPYSLRRTSKVNQGQGLLSEVRAS